MQRPLSDEEVADALVAAAIRDAVEDFTWENVFMVVPAESHEDDFERGEIWQRALAEASARPGPPCGVSRQELRVRGVELCVQGTDWDGSRGILLPRTCARCMRRADAHPDHALFNPALASCVSPGHAVLEEILPRVRDQEERAFWGATLEWERGQSSKRAGARQHRRSRQHARRAARGAGGRSGGGAS